MSKRFFFLLPLLFLALAGGVSAVDFDSLNNDTVAYYTFDENTGTTAGDSTPNNNEASFVGSPSWTTGIINSGLTFDGSNDYLSIPHDVSFKPSLPVSFSVWINVDSAVDFKNIMSNDDSYTAFQDNFYGLGLQQGPDNKIYAAIRDGDTSGTGSRRTFTTDNTVPLNEWAHVVAVFKGGSDIDVYINGVNQSGSYSGSGSGVVSYSSDQPGLIGGYGVTDRGLEGVIDEPAIFDKALTPDEVSFLYASGSPGVAQQYPFGAAGLPFSSVRVLDLFDDAALSDYDLGGDFQDWRFRVTWPNLDQGSKSNFTGVDGVAECNNCSGDLSFEVVQVVGDKICSGGCTVSGSKLYFDDDDAGFYGPRVAVQNATYDTYLFGARYNLSAVDSLGNSVSSFNVSSGLQFNETSDGSLDLVLKPNSSNSVLFEAVGFVSENFSVSASGRDLGSQVFNVSFDSNVTVRAVSALNTSEVISGLCARLNGSSFFDERCTTSGDNISWEREVPHGVYNLTTYSVGSGDGSSAAWARNTSEVSINGSHEFNLSSEPLSLSLSFRDEDNRTSLAGLPISVTVIDESGFERDFVTNTSEINITGVLTEGEYVVRYTASGYSTRDFFFDLSLDQPLTEETLYLLWDGVLVPGEISVSAFDGSPLEGATVVMSRFYGNSSVPNQVQFGLTDSQGKVTFVAKSVTVFYSFRVELGGQVLFQDDNPELLTLEQDGLWYKTIIVDAQGLDAVSSTTGLEYSFGPSGVVSSGVLTNFSFNVSSSNHSLTSCEFRLLDESGVVVNSTSGFCGSGGGGAVLSFNASGPGWLSAEAFVASDDFNNTYTGFWRVVDFSPSRFTLSDLAADLRGFSGGGFGDVSRFIIAVLAVLMVTFSLSSVTSFLNNPEEVLLFMFVFSLLFSYIGWLRVDIPGMPVDALKDYFVSVLLGLWSLGAALRKQGVL